MDKSKYYFTFDKLIKKLDNLNKIEVPKGYIEIDARKNSKKSTKHKEAKQG